MYGDCQVISTMGGNVVSSETLFSSPPIQNSNYNFMSSMPFQPFPTMIAVSFLIFTVYIYIYIYLLCISLYMSLVQILLQKEENGFLGGKDEMESGSGSEQVEEKSANEQESEQPSKKKRYHRHTARQIQEMETYVQY